MSTVADILKDIREDNKDFLDNTISGLSIDSNVFFNLLIEIIKEPNTDTASIVTKNLSRICTLLAPVGSQDSIIKEIVSAEGQRNRENSGGRNFLERYILLLGEPNEKNKSLLRDIQSVLEMNHCISTKFIVSPKNKKIVDALNKLKTLILKQGVDTNAIKIDHMVNFSIKITEENSNHIHYRMYLLVKLSENSREYGSYIISDNSTILLSRDLVSLLIKEKNEIN